MKDTKGIVVINLNKELFLTSVQSGHVIKFSEMYSGTSIMKACITSTKANAPSTPIEHNSLSYCL
jgi:uncharacterized protein YegP (UPF0339 family)